MTELQTLISITVPILGVILIGIVWLMRRGEIDRNDGSSNRAQERQEARGGF